MDQKKKQYQPLSEDKGQDKNGSISFHKPPVEEVLKLLKTNTKTGLTTENANNLISIYGANELEKKEEESIWEKIKEQFEDVLVRILLLSALISFLISYFGKREEHDIPPWVEPFVIFTILIVNALVGIYQDLDAERALEALKDLQAQNALVLRDGEWVSLNAVNLVPGDIVQLTQGNKVPADIRLVELKTISLKINQSILTGEVNPVSKSSEGINQDKLTLQGKLNYAFSGTLIASGTGIGVVVETGMKTEIGKIHKSLLEKEDEDTPLKKKLDEFGDLLAKIIGVVCLVNWLINIGNFSDPIHGGFVQGALYYFKIAVALAVAAIPEGLPAVITTCLALGTRRMAKKRAIVRTLQSVETLGCTTVICSDKTGTLTTNEMTVKHFLLPNDDASDNFRSFKVAGVSFDTQGEIQGLDEYSKGGFPWNLSLFCQSMSLNNESKLIIDEGKNKRSKIGAVGLPTEAALKVLVEKIGAYDKNTKSAREAIDQVEKYNQILHNQFEIISTLEFTRDRKSMSSFCLDKNSKKEILFIKGAPERIVQRAKSLVNKSGETVPLNARNKEELLKRVKELAKEGLRCLAIAVKFDTGVLKGFDGKNKSHPGFAHLEDHTKYSALEDEPVLLGIVAMQDPPRPEVRAAIEKCKRAGISVVMITGDIKETAETVAREIGIVDNDNAIVQSRSIMGEDFEKMSEKQQIELTSKCIGSLNGLIFSRTEPLHKKQLVQILSKQNQIVAMTGDGVNDAPALKQAHIGIAMGIAGTEVAKEASDMILSDDNFSTIVAAVEEGRAIFSNMKAFIRYMISSNIGEVVSIFTSSMLGIPDGFNSIQLLWVNLVTDGLPATALSFNPSDPDIMEKPPRKHDEPIITPWIFFRYMVIGTYVGLATVGIFVYWYIWYDWADDGHQLVLFSQLSRWGDCENWKDFTVKSFGEYDFSKNPCSYFTWGKQMPSTLSLSVLVVIEMFNALNALSEDQSLLKIGIFGNPWLLYAITGSIVLHCGILYIPFLRAIFGTAPLGLKEWALVVGFSFPVVIIDELLKSFGRQRTEQAQKKRYSSKNE